MSALEKHAVLIASLAAVIVLAILWRAYKMFKLPEDVMSPEQQEEIRAARMSSGSLSNVSSRTGERDLDKK